MQRRRTLRNLKNCSVQKLRESLDGYKSLDQKLSLSVQVLRTVTLQRRGTLEKWEKLFQLFMPFVLSAQKMDRFEDKLLRKDETARRKVLVIVVHFSLKVPNLILNNAVTLYLFLGQCCRLFKNVICDFSKRRLVRAKLLNDINFYTL